MTFNLFNFNLISWTEQPIFNAWKIYNFFFKITVSILNLSFLFQLDSRILKCWGIGYMLEENSMIKRYCEYVKTNSTSESLLASPVSSNATLVPSSCQDKGVIGKPHSCSFVFYDTGLNDITIGIILLVVSLTILCTSLVLIVKLLNSMLKGLSWKVLVK